MGYLGFASNGKLLKEKNLEPPKSWNDLLKPEYRGSGTGYTLLASMFQLRGEEDALEYMKKLDKQIKTYQRSGSAPAKMAGQGECLIGISFLHDAIKFRESGMKDLVLTSPSEGTGYEVGAVSLIKGGPDQEAAKMFIDWCLTAQFLTHPDAKPPKQADELKGTQLIKYNFLWSGKHRDEVVNKWEKEIDK